MRLGFESALAQILSSAQRKLGRIDASFALADERTRGGGID
jgi:hypothetical protein